MEEQSVLIRIVLQIVNPSVMFKCKSIHPSHRQRYISWSYYKQLWLSYYKHVGKCFFLSVP